MFIHVFIPPIFNKTIVKPTMHLAQPNKKPYIYTFKNSKKNLLLFSARD